MLFQQIVRHTKLKDFYKTYCLCLYKAVYPRPINLIKVQLYLLFYVVKYTLTNFSKLILVTLLQYLVYIKLLNTILDTRIFSVNGLESVSVYFQHPLSFVFKQNDNSYVYGSRVLTLRCFVWHYNLSLIHI